MGKQRTEGICFEKKLFSKLIVLLEYSHSYNVVILTTKAVGAMATIPIPLFEALKKVFAQKSGIRAPKHSLKSNQFSPFSVLCGSEQA